MSDGEPPTEPKLNAFKNYRHDKTTEKDISSFANTTPVSERIKVWDALTRNGLAVGIMITFLVVNAFTLGVLVWLGREDQHNLVL